MFDKILSRVGDYYGARISEHGATPKGVDWNSADAQTRRFEQLAKVLPDDRPFSLVDYGCGYGALARYLVDKSRAFSYQGFDISRDMIEQARTVSADIANCRFTTDRSTVESADFAIASGIFNVRFDVNNEEWTSYVDHEIGELARLGSRGFSFNMLTKYSDADRMRSDLYYGDPGRFFDLCRRLYSRNVALLHDYGLYEFTIIVRRDVP